MPRANLGNGDAGDLTATFTGNTIQQGVTFKTAGTLTLSTIGCHVYIFDLAISSISERAKIVDGQPPRDFPVQANWNYDTRAAGTTDANPTGTLHYSFTAP